MPRLCAVVVCLGTMMTAAAAAELPRYDISVRVDAETRQVSGHARIVVTNDSDAPLRELDLWRYPERFATRSKALNDYNFYWIYPTRFNAGHMRTGPVVVDGRAVSVAVRDDPRAGPGTLLAVALEPPLQPGAHVTVDVDFSDVVPERYGSFGCVGGDCTLVGFYPLVREPGQPDDGEPGRGDYRVSVASAHTADVTVNGELRAITPRVGATEYRVGPAPGLTLTVGRPALRRYERVQRGVHITLLAPISRGVPSPSESVLPYQPANRVDRVLDTAAEAVDLLCEWGLTFRPDDEIRIVEGKLRIQLAQALPGVVLASDEIFDIFPLNRFLKFHEFELARAIFETLLAQRVYRQERSDDLGWTPGAGAAHLVELYTLRSYRKAEFAREILAWASFIPAIDRVMYAPQVPFASSYFYTLEDPDPLRDLLTQFDNNRPTGKTLDSKLTDLLGAKTVDDITRAQVAGGSLRAAAEAAQGGSLDWFWQQWLGKYPFVDYRFTEIKSQHVGKGHWRHVAHVVKRGEHPPIEPVEVRVESNGRSLTETWDGRGDGHDFVFETSGPISWIAIDPRGRLVEELPNDNNDLKFDDRRPPRWKFIYNNFGGLLRFFPTLGIDLSLDFSLARILDLKNSFRFVVYRSEATEAGVQASYTRAYGAKVTQAHLTSAFTWTVGGARLDPSFAEAVGAKSNPGTSLSASMAWNYDDRLFIWEPARALSLGASVGVVETVLDDGVVLSQATVAAGWESIVPIADGQGLAFTINGAATFGDLKIARQMVSAGGGTALRGYDVAGELGRWNIFGRAEWRHNYTHALNWNLLHSIYVRGIGGGLFAEAGVVSPCEGYTPNAQSAAADVGYTIRVFADWFGVSQTTMNIDLAVPIVSNNTRGCFGPIAGEKNRVPFGFFLSFGPPW